MKKSMLVLCILTFYLPVLLAQDKYSRLLDKVDLTDIQQYTPGMIPENTVQYDPKVADIINQTNLDSLVSFIRILSGEDSVWVGNTKVLIQNRGNSGGDLAADYLKQKLESYNLLVYDQLYSGSGRNVYALQKGYLYPEKQYIICAHYDAVNVYCADDNASGAAAVIEAARILSKYGSKSTLIYALWDEEEKGLIGSNYYASQALSNQEQIEGVLNMDMLAWDGNNDNLIDIHTKNIGKSNELANMLVEVNRLYSVKLNPIIYNPGTWQSDHSSFWNYGFGAVLVIEAYYGNDLNPYYHGINDRIDKLNLSYYHKLSKLSIGTISTLVEVTKDTLIISVTPTIGYQTYQPNILIKGYNTHFMEASDITKVCLSKGLDKITADSVDIVSNTLLNAYFNFTSTAPIGLWDVNVEDSIDGILKKNSCFNILPPPAIINVYPDSLVVGVLSGSTKTKTITISNQGKTNLNFNVIGGFSSINYALHFDGLDDYVEVPDDISLKPNNSITMECWVKFEQGGTYQPHIISKAYEAYGEGYELLLTNVSWFCNVEQRILPGSLISQSFLTADDWYHIASVYDGSNSKIYINGILDTLVIHTGLLNSSNINLYLGQKSAGDWERYKGIMDEIRIWNVARSQTDIQKFMNRQLSGTESGLVGYWQFDEGTGNIAVDKTAYSNNGILNGGVQWTDIAAPVLPGWLQMSTESRFCLPHTSMDIELLFDATTIDTGDYYASIRIKSSDPFTPTVTVPIHLIVSTTVGIENDINKPLTFYLYQNHPNPFNPSTKIKYSISNQSLVTLKVFDILGREVQTLINEEKPSGNYKVEFNAASLPSGVYFYQLRAGDFIQTKKMILMK